MLAGMGLVQRQFNRYERKLSAVMAPGEKILGYDVGRYDDGRGVNALASTHAFYFLFNGGATVRVAYTDMLELHASTGLVAMATRQGNQFAFTFKRPSKTFPSTLLEAAQARMQSARMFAASWGSAEHPTGVLFTVEPDGSYSLAYTGEWEQLMQIFNDMVSERACSELDVALGLEPKFGFPPMAEKVSLTWSPELPGNS